MLIEVLLKNYEQEQKEDGPKMHERKIKSKEISELNDRL